MRDTYSPTGPLFVALLLAIAVHAAMICGIRVDLPPNPPVETGSLEAALVPRQIELTVPPSAQTDPHLHDGPDVTPRALSEVTAASSTPEPPTSEAKAQEQPVVSAAVPRIAYSPDADPKHRHTAERPSAAAADERRARDDIASEQWAERNPRPAPAPGSASPSSSGAMAVAAPASEPGSAGEAATTSPATSWSEPNGASGASEPRSGETSEGQAATPAEPVRLTAAALDRQISEWTADYTRSQEQESAQPSRTAYVEKVASHRYLADAYERAWQDKVERVGNLNYPEEARRKNLTGGLLLSVGVNTDGSLHSISVRKSSGHEELDQAAIRIVRLAAPFAAFPLELKKDYDVLVITRTWRFFVDNRLATTP